MVCSDVFDRPAVCVREPCKTHEKAEDRLSALSPSLRKHFIESVQYNKEMLEELAEM
jgi:hypothetical protein